MPTAALTAPASQHSCLRSRCCSPVCPQGYEMRWQHQAGCKCSAPERCDLGMGLRKDSTFGSKAASLGKAASAMRSNRAPGLCRNAAKLQAVVARSRSDMSMTLISTSLCRWRTTRRTLMFMVARDHRQSAISCEQKLHHLHGSDSLCRRVQKGIRCRLMTARTKIFLWKIATKDSPQTTNLLTMQTTAAAKDVHPYRR